jgi:hypothetical protein
MGVEAPCGEVRASEFKSQYRPSGDVKGDVTELNY